MIAKAGLGIIGLGAISIGGVAFTKPEWLGINRETPWTPLFKDHNYDSKKGNDYAETKFGGKYKNYLVGVVGTKGGAGQENTNKAMWDELFKKWETDFKSGTNTSALGNKFKEKIDEAIKPSSANGKYLNTICEEIYKSAKENVTADGAGTDKYKEADVWKYCSVLGEKPTTISEEEAKKYTANNAIGSRTNKSKLVSVEGNDKFWEIRDKEFRNIDGYGKIEATEDEFFKPSKKKEPIRELCRLAYSEAAASTNSDTNKPTETQALKYCSFFEE